MGIINKSLDIPIKTSYTFLVNCNYFCFVEVFLVRRVSLLAFTLALCLCLSACSSGGDSAPAPEEPTPAAIVETPETENPLLRAEFVVSDVLSGTGKKIGERGSVSVKKTDLPDFSSSDFAAYMTEFVDSRISGTDFNYVTIFFDDGTGFIFAGGNDTFGTYCRPDFDGAISTRPLGECSREKGFQFVDYEIRVIPDFTIKQETLVEENYFQPVDEIIFSTPASENGLGDTPFWVEGEVVSRSNLGGYDTIQLSTEYGDLYISAAFIDFPEISEGDEATVYFVYSGFSDALGAPCGVYVYHE